MGFILLIPFNYIKICLEWLDNTCNHQPVYTGYEESAEVHEQLKNAVSII